MSIVNRGRDEMAVGIEPRLRDAKNFNSIEAPTPCQGATERKARMSVAGAAAAAGIESCVEHESENFNDSYNFIILIQKQSDNVVTIEIVRETYFQVTRYLQLNNSMQTCSLFYEKYDTMIVFRQFCNIREYKALARCLPAAGRSFHRF